MVNTEGSTSQEFEVVSSVIQGSEFGPLQFIIHISDIDEDLQNYTLRSIFDVRSDKISGIGF